MDSFWRSAKSIPKDGRNILLYSIKYNSYRVVRFDMDLGYFVNDEEYREVEINEGDFWANIKPPIT